MQSHASPCKAMQIHANPCKPHAKPFKAILSPAFTIYAMQSLSPYPSHLLYTMQYQVKYYVFRIQFTLKLLNFALLQRTIVTFYFIYFNYHKYNDYYVHIYMEVLGLLYPSHFLYHVFLILFSLVS